MLTLVQRVGAVRTFLAVLSHEDVYKRQVESLAPEVKDLTRTEMTELMEHIFSLSEVQRAVRHRCV